jgi:hypothetical protein
LGKKYECKKTRGIDHALTETAKSINVGFWPVILLKTLFQMMIEQGSGDNLCDDVKKGR